MIGLIKSVFLRSVKKKTVIFDRFAANVTDGSAAFGGAVGSAVLRVGETLCAKRLLNCDLSGGALRRGVGASLYYTEKGVPVWDIPYSDVVRVVDVRCRADGQRAERFLFVLADGTARLYDERQRKIVGSVTVGADGNAVLLRSVAGEEKYLVAGGLGAYFLGADNTFTQADYTDQTGIFCTCKNRLFLVKKGGVLAYSDPMTPWVLQESIDDGGVIVLPTRFGQPIALVAVGGYVYVFFVRAVMRLEVRGSGKEFSLEEIAYDGDTIVGGSVCAALENVVFLANDGVRVLCGRGIERLCEGVYPKVDLQGAVCNAAVAEGKYFVQYPHKDGGVRALAIDLDGKNYCDVYELLGLCGGDSGAFFLFDEQLLRIGGKELPVGAVCQFQSVDIDFGLRGKKNLRSIELVGEGNMVIDVVCDGKLLRHSVAFENGRAILALNVRGERFSFVISLKKDACLRCVRAEIVA